MNISRIANQAKHLVLDNSPAILTGIGVTGTLTVAYLTGKATFRAAKVLSDEQFKRNIHENDGKKHPLSFGESFKLTWHLYLPAAGVATLTCVSIIGANRIGTRRAAAMAAAYSISERAFTEYREKVIEKIGENKERAVRDEIAQDRVNRNPPVESMIVRTGEGDFLCQDGYSGRYFYSTQEKLRRAENDINFQILNHDYATVSNFYSNIKLAPTSESDYVGWNHSKRLELHFSTVLANGEDGVERPCMVVDFATVPFPNPWQLG